MPAGRVFRQIRAQWSQRRATAAVDQVPYTYTYDFTGSNGAGWTGWTTVAGTVDIQSNQGRQLTAASAYAVAAAYYNAGLPQDYELRVDTTITTVTAAEFYAAVNLRAGSTAFTDMMQRSSWHLRFVGTATAGTAELYRVDSAGTPILLVAASDIDFVQGSVLHVRILVAGQVFKARYWKDFNPEPSTWQIDGTDSFAPVGNSLSLAIRNGNDAAADDWRWDNISIGFGVTGTGASTLAGVASAANGGGATGTAAVTAGNVTSAAAGSQVALDPTPYSAPAQLYVTGGVYRRRYIMRRGAQGVLTAFSVSGAVNATLDSVQAVSPLLDENSLPVLDENSEPIYSAGATAAFGNSGAVNKALANVTSTTAGSSVVGTVARTLQNLLIAASGGSSNAGALAETMDPVVLQAVGGQGVTGTVNKALAALTSTAAGATGGVFGTVAVTLDAVDAIAPITDETGDPITDESGGAILVRGAEGFHGIGGTVGVTLANIVSSSSGQTGGASGTVAVSFDDVTAAATGTHGVPGTLAETLDNVTVSAGGTVGVTGTVSVTLANTTSAADGTASSTTVAGNLAATLDAVVAAAGGTSVAGEVVKTLADATAAATGTAGLPPVTGAAAVILANITLQAAGYPTVIGTLARTLAETLGDGAGSGVAGTLAETLDDVTSQTTANVSITVYGFGTIDAIYQAGPIDSVFETGRIVAVAGSAH